MDQPKHDKTLRDEVIEALLENVRLGQMIEVSPGRFSLTDTGKARAETLLAESQEARDLLTNLIAAHKL